MGISPAPFSSASLQENLTQTTLLGASTGTNPAVSEGGSQAYPNGPAQTQPLPSNNDSTASNYTAGSAGGTPFFVQPQFDPRIYTLPFGADNGTLTRGYMKWDSTGGYVSGYTSPAIVHFLYNPTTVSISSSIDNTQQTIANQYVAPQNQTNLLTPLQQTVSFSLLFDRTFDVWGQYNTTGQPNSLPVGSTGGLDSAAQQGCNVDIRAMKQLTGQLSNLGAGGGNPMTTQPVLQQGPMFMIDTWLYFGDPASDFFFYGYVSDFTVTVTHWSQYMVPMRCEIDVDFSLFPNSFTTNAPDKPGSVTSPNSDLWWSTQPLSSVPGSSLASGSGTSTVGTPVSPTILGSGSIAGIGGR